MIARVNQGKLEAKDIEAATEFFETVWIPGGREQDGFRGAILLTRADGNSLAIDIYDTEEQALATEESGWYQQTTELFADKITGRVRRNFYEATIGLAGPVPENAETPEPTS